MGFAVFACFPHPQNRTQFVLLKFLSLHLCFPKSSQEFVVSSCPRAAFVTLDAKTLGNNIQSCSANAKLGDFFHSNKSSHEILEREKNYAMLQTLEVCTFKNTYIAWLLRRARLHRKRIWDVCTESGVWKFWAHTVYESTEVVSSIKPDQKKKWCRTESCVLGRDCCEEKRLQSRFVTNIHVQQNYSSWKTVVLQLSWVGEWTKQRY